MAPEYLVRGQLIEKADVYSFGVLVLEIVSGRKDKAPTEDSYSLIQTVWKLYKTNSLGGLVDPHIKDDFPAKEASRVLQIGLLCTQAPVDLQPSMAEVVQILTNIECEIPEPKQPPFLTSSGLNLASSGGSYGINSLISNALTKIKGSYPSTESSSSNETLRSEGLKPK
ncbi:unnamed protein product [Camellia sinensis]